MTKITCLTCNGLGQKTRSRGNHSSISRVTKCYTCMGEGTVECTKDVLKEGIVSYLKDLRDEKLSQDITALWGTVKTWCENKNYTMGGSYMSTAKDMNVSILVDKKLFKFKLSFSDLK